LRRSRVADAARARFSVARAALSSARPRRRHPVLIRCPASSAGEAAWLSLHASAHRAACRDRLIPGRNRACVNGSRGLLAAKPRRRCHERRGLHETRGRGWPRRGAPKKREAEFHAIPVGTVRCTKLRLASRRWPVTAAFATSAESPETG